MDLSDKDMQTLLGNSIQNEIEQAQSHTLMIYNGIYLLMIYIGIYTSVYIC